MKYLSEYDPVSVYANACDLIIKHSCAPGLHLDIGCGNAPIAEALIRSGYRYIGFDFDSETLRRLCDRGLIATFIDLEDEVAAINVLDQACGGENPVSISMLDVLEHLSIGNRFLTHLSAWLKSRSWRSILVTSIPNFAHDDLVLKLYSGYWDYTDTGLLDRTHGVVYTGNSIELTLARSGWTKVGEKNYYLHSSDQSTLHRGLPQLNDECGVGVQLRGIRKVFYADGDVHQYVGAYVPDDHSFSSDSADSEVELVVLVPDGFDVESAEAGGFMSWVGVERTHWVEISRWYPSKRFHTVPVYVTFIGFNEFHYPALENSIFDALRSRPNGVKYVLCASPQTESDDVSEIIADSRILAASLPPGPGVYIPYQFFIANPISDSLLRDKNQWLSYLLRAVIVCGSTKIDSIESADTACQSQVKSHLDNNECWRLIDVVSNVQFVDEVVANLWPGSRNIEEWLSLPFRLRYKNALGDIDYLKRQLQDARESAKSAEISRQVFLMQAANREQILETQLKVVSAQVHELASSLRSMQSNWLWKVLCVIKNFCGKLRKK